MKLNSTRKVRKRMVNGKENVSVIFSKESIFLASLLSDALGVTAV